MHPQPSMTPSEALARSEALMADAKRTYLMSVALSLLCVVLSLITLARPDLFCAATAAPAVLP